MWPQLALFYLLMAWPTESSAQVVDLPFMEYLDSSRLVLLRWGFDEVQGNITFTVSIQTTGWIGFGLSPNGNMIGADIVTGGVGTSGIYFKDRHSTGNFLPMEDREQSYDLLSMTEVEGRTSMTFRRAIQTCDEDDFHITAKPIKLIYAYGETDEMKYHSTRRGTKEVNLLKYMPRVTLPDGVYFDFTVDNIPIPARKTHYHCRVKKMPRLNVTHHVYRIEPVIDNLDLVHHMLLYGCPRNVTDDYDGNCYTGNIVDSCFKVTAAWAVGGGAFELPEEAGIPIGGNNSNILYRLEIHYNNPTSVAGRQDSSGLRLYYTSKLRKHSVGTLTTGVVPAGVYTIPRGATQFHTYGTCNTSLFSELMQGPVPDLQVFAMLLHTHLAGRTIRAGLFRDGKQVDFLAVDKNYDFEMQETVNVGNIKTIKPNDDILVECTYNTTNRNGYTTMGLSTTDEMCLAFLLYYPEIPVHTCWSLPNMSNIENVNQPADQQNITNYENELRTNPQIQIVTDDRSLSFVHVDGMVLNMKDTPAVSCRSNPPTVTTASSGGSRHRLDVGGGGGGGGGALLLLLLLWSAV
ncbi:unnamed protein product [Lota lota]